LAVYTPQKQITACELTSNGKYVVLALKNSQKLVTLELKGGDYQAQEDENQNSTYGNKENEAKVFDLKD
jgi:predicted peptidase